MPVRLMAETQIELLNPVPIPRGVDVIHFFQEKPSDKDLLIFQLCLEVVTLKHS